MACLTDSQHRVKATRGKDEADEGFQEEEWKKMEAEESRTGKR